MFTPEIVVQKVKIGMTRDEVKAALGEPTDISIGSRKYPRPCIWKYGDVELHFNYPEDGGVWLVYMEDKDKSYTPHTLLIDPRMKISDEEMTRRSKKHEEKMKRKCQH